MNRNRYFIYPNNLISRSLYKFLMDQARVSKFFKVYVNNTAQKVFLDDVSAIYKVNAKKTPPLNPYFDNSSDCMSDK